MKFEIIAEGLVGPEGPVVCADGSVLVVEMYAGRISRVRPNGRVETVAETGGGPNGLAVGPDGALYCCNNGGTDPASMGTPFTYPPADYKGGTIQRVDVSTGKVETVLSEYEGRTLAGPNDIVFASDGSFWFSDFGKSMKDGARHGGLFHAHLDGDMRQVSFGTRLNGVGLSPDEKTVYATATFERWILEFDASPRDDLQPGKVIASFPGRQFLDSMAVEADGGLAVGCLFDNSGIGRFNPADGALSLVPAPDPMPTNIAFGGPDMRTAYITFTVGGLLAKCEWPAPGRSLPFNL